MLLVQEVWSDCVTGPGPGAGGGGPLQAGGGGAGLQRGGAAVRRRPQRPVHQTHPARRPRPQVLGLLGLLELGVLELGLVTPCVINIMCL